MLMNVQVGERRNDLPCMLSRPAALAASCQHNLSLLQSNVFFEPVSLLHLLEIHAHFESMHF